MSFWLALATYLLAVTALLGLFARGDVVGDRKVGALTRRWAFDRGAGVDAWSEGFLAWFDAVFAVRKFNLPVVGEVMLPSLLRSILASLVGLILMALVWVLNKDSLARPLRFQESLSDHQVEEMTVLLVVYGGATLITNWIPDYLSLVQSRWVLGRMAAARSWLGRLAWLVVDMIATLAIAFSAIYIGMVIALPIASQYMTIQIGCLNPETFGIGEAWTLFVAGLTFQSPPATINYDVAGIYIYSTFLTSVWVWLYAITGLIVRQAASLRTARQGIVPTRPLLTLGVVGAIGFSLVFWTTYARSEPQVDVIVFAADDEAVLADRVAAALREDGLIVARESVPSSDEAITRALTRADLAILVGPDGVDADALALLDGAARMSAAGQRPDDALLRLVVRSPSTPRGVYRDRAQPRRNFAEGWAPLVAYWPVTEAPGEDLDPQARDDFSATQADTLGHLSQWARYSGALLSPSQLRVCRERFSDRWGFDREAYRNAPDPHR